MNSSLTAHEPAPVYLLGNDPAMARYGWAIVQLLRDTLRVVAMGVIVTKPSDKKHRVLAACDDMRRAQEISMHLRNTALCGGKRGGHRYNVRAATYEAISLPRNARSSSQIGMGFGALAALADYNGLPLREVSPQALKKSVAGNGSATKLEVAIALGQKYGLRVVWPAGRKTVQYVEGLDLLGAVTPGDHEHAWDALGSVDASLDTDIIKALRPAA